MATAMPRWQKRVKVELERELELLRRDKKNGVTFLPYTDDESSTGGATKSPESLDDISIENMTTSSSSFANITGYILGPPDTPYENGVFKVAIDVPFDYPLIPPKMRFLTIPWHPNVSSQTGAICVDILKHEWTPLMHIRSCLISLQCLLQSPNADDPQDHMVASQYLNQTAEWESTAKSWTKNRAYTRSVWDTLVSQKNESVYTRALARLKGSKAIRPRKDPAFDGSNGVVRDRDDCTCAIS